MKSSPRYIQESLAAEERRQCVEAERDAVDRAAKAFGFRPEAGEPDHEFRARVPAIVRAMAPYNPTAARFAKCLH
jgi:hypothetical protein